MFAMLLLISVATPAETPSPASSPKKALTGCHSLARGGPYHCHDDGRASRSRFKPVGVLATRIGAFRSCSEARAAGADPVRRDDPGYGRHLDPDGDGIACRRASRRG
jgi:hypothetical protein